LRIQPDHLYSLVGLSTVMKRLGKHDRAVYLLRHLVDHHPNFADGHAYLATALIMLKRFDEARAAARRGWELDPNSPIVLNARGEVYLEFDLPEEALPLLERAAILRPDDVEIADNLGRAYLQLRRAEDSLRVIDHAISIRPDLPDLHHTR